MKTAFSMSTKRAGVVFTDPEKGQTTCQEHAGIASEKLRASVRKAESAFWAEYNDPKWKKQAAK